MRASGIFASGPAGRQPAVPGSRSYRIAKGVLIGLPEKASNPDWLRSHHVSKVVDFSRGTLAPAVGAAQITEAVRNGETVLVCGKTLGDSAAHVADHLVNAYGWTPCYSRAYVQNALPALPHVRE